MKRFILITTIILSSFNFTFKGHEYNDKEIKEISKFHKGLSMRKYVDKYMYYWESACRLSKKMPDGRFLNDMETVLKIDDICRFIGNYAKFKYTEFAIKCYLDKVKFTACLLKKDIISELSKEDKN
jgi:hypothetical protein